MIGPFTDDDLKRLKERPWCSHEKHAPRDCGVLASILESDLPALFARLEAAERCAELLGLVIDGSQLDRVTRAWRKAAGK